MTPSRFCTSCGANRDSARTFCTACGSRHATPSAVLPAEHAIPRPTPQMRKLRCVECSSEIDAGLVCARCASRTGQVAAVSSAPTVPDPPTAPLAAVPNPAPVPVHIQVVAQSPAPEPKEEDGSALPSIAASLAFGGLMLTLGEGSTFVVKLTAMAAVAAAAFAMVVAAIWGRPSGQNAFWSVAFVACGFMLFVRLTATPSIGVTMNDFTDGWVTVTGVRAGSAAEAAGVPVYSYLAAIDGKAVHSSAEVQAIVAGHRVFDQIRVTAVSGIDPVMRDYDVMIGR